MRKRVAFPPSVVAAISERDGGLCALCGEPVSSEDRTLDHIQPFSAGGPDDLENLQLAHRLCNIRKGPHGAPSVFAPRWERDARRTAAPTMDETAAFPQMYTVEAAAEFLDAPLRSVYRMITSGELSAVHVGRLWRIREDDLVAFQRVVRRESLPTRSEGE